MALVTLAFALCLSLQDPDREHIDELVNDLSSASLGTRISAEHELRGIGRDALPALKRATESGDEERARRARTLIQELESQEADPDARAAGRVRMFYKDVARRITFEVKPDGSVTLQAPADGEKGEIKTWTAKSADEFRREHPELVRKYGLDGVLAGGDLEAEFERMRADLERLMAARAERWRAQERAPEANGKPRFGVMVSEIPEALRAHLNIDAGRGVLVLDVAEESVASRAGVERHDIILELDGRPVAGVDAFAKEIAESLGRDRVVIKAIRHGEPRELTLTPVPAK